MKRILITISILLIASICFSQYAIQKIDAGTDDGIHDIEITAKGTIFIYTYGTGKILKSSNDGTSWEISANLDSIYFEQIQFIDEQNGWICGEYGKIYHSNDGGNNWHDQSIKIEKGNLLLYGMYFKDKDNGMVSGAILHERKLKNKVYKTSDGGIHWKDMDQELPGMILNLEQSPAGKIWGSGGNIIIKHENDGWNIMFYDSTKATRQIRDLLFIGDQTVIAVSFNGKLLKSSDGGQNWEIITVTENRLRSVALLPDNSIIAAGDKNKENGNVFISKNEGESWDALNEDFNDIHRIAVHESNCWLVGKNGTILKYHPTNH